MRTPTLEELADREAIREAANRYVHGIDRLDSEWAKSAYWPEAIDDHGVFVGNAWEFVDWVTPIHAQLRWTMHSTTNHQIDLTGDGVTATGELYNVAHLMTADGSTLNTWFGRYLDRYEKRGDEWRIIHRVCVHEGTRTESEVPPMHMPADRFRQGNFDRATAGRPLGP